MSGHFQFILDRQTSGIVGKAAKQAVRALQFQHYTNEKKKRERNNNNSTMNKINNWNGNEMEKDYILHC